MSDEAIQAFGQDSYDEMVASAASHIDKTCTGGSTEDFVAAAQIIDDLYAKGVLQPTPDSRRGALTSS